MVHEPIKAGLFEIISGTADVSQASDKKVEQLITSWIKIGL